ncbi:Flp pilus assembly protein TadG [Limimaricola soesokkakensis]|uniref:Flp pilus assembly protein TadG n=1 Tax=Limimaricola soesokkakensis TaxID=1343159 RepID=A0A1X7A0Q4_9RHOB|nr:TadE/TadG family type IV pilus assembly protein [Limimaricola soesokkakensis]PSK81567.1 Flp pilus assembly protein TadG [Limimaricola soesokkakensis]SLN67311.1 hypothetical protein LOS8367_03358 [Limimaricola soesokkakensis]
MSWRDSWRRFRAADSGSITAEFVILFPVVMYIFLLGIETSLWNTRELMLRRATNLAVRDVRLSTATPPSYEEMRRAICARSIFISGCEANLRIEMQALPLADWARVTSQAKCVEKGGAVDPALDYRPGQQNELMMVRVCRMFDPIFPGGGLGRKISQEHGGEYAVRVVTGFVAEPRS